jgi:hypothetical protein
MAATTLASGNNSSAATGRPAESGDASEVRDPFTGEIVVLMPASESADALRAMAAAAAESVGSRTPQASV